MLDQPSRRQGIESADVAKQRWTGHVDVHANSVDTKLNDIVKRFGKMFGFDVVLVHSNTDVRRANFDKLRHGILQTASNRHGAANRRTGLGQLFTTDFTGRVNTGSGFINHHVANRLVFTQVSCDAI